MGKLCIGDREVAPILTKTVTEPEWQPDPLWPDIEKLLIENWPSQISKETGHGCAVLLYGFSDTATINVSGSYSKPDWAILSDGTEYDWNNSTVTHAWDKTKDVYDSNGLPVRYILFYNAASSDYGLGLYDSSWFDDPVVYIYFNGEFNYSGSNAFSGHNVLQNIKIDGKLTCAASTGLLKDAYNLTKVPDNLYTTGTYGSEGVPFSGTKITEIPTDRFVLNNSVKLLGSEYWEYRGAVVLPEIFFKGKIESLWGFGGTSADSGLFECLVKIPDGWDLSSCTDFARAGVYLNNLVFAGTVDMSNNTSNLGSSTKAAFNCVNLVDIKCTLPSNTNVWFDRSDKISIESFRFMADHAPDVTATPRTLTVGATNLSRINAADPTIITDLNAKGWTVA